MFGFVLELDGPPGGDEKVVNEEVGGEAEGGEREEETVDNDGIEEVNEDDVEFSCVLLFVCSFRTRFTGLEEALERFGVTGLVMGILAGETREDGREERMKAGRGRQVDEDGSDIDKQRNGQASWRENLINKQLLKVL